MSASLTKWVARGYADHEDRTVYRRSPAPNPPMVPDSELPPEWAAYFDGFRAGVRNAFHRVMKRKRGEVPYDSHIPRTDG